MPETIFSKVAGVDQENEDGESRQALIRKYLNEGDELELEREPGNPYDHNAIAVYGYRDLPIEEYELDPEFKIGYLNKKKASDLASLLDNHQIIRCHVKNITGGTEDQSIGVNIELKIYSPEESDQIKQLRKQQEKIDPIQSASTPLSSEDQTKQPELKIRPKSGQKILKTLLVVVATIFLLGACMFFGASAQSKGDIGPTIVGIILGLICLIIASSSSWQLWRMRRVNKRL